MTHPACLSEDELLRECTVRFLRRSGPGGQHRNKVETAVRIRHEPTGIEAEASERRSQAENRAVALHRLRLKLAREIRYPSRPATQPGLLWQSRRRGRRLEVNSSHPDFPALLAEALDVLSGRNFSVPAAAEVLGISPSQLIKLLKKDPPAFQWVNACRSAAGLHRLR